jgi:SAM-dependent methyltransferase
MLSGRTTPRYNLQRHLSRQDALAARRGELEFRFCPVCAFAFNAAFKPEQMDYAVDYEASRATSRVFVEYLQDLCRRVHAVWDLSDAQVVEVGCGDGQFLTELRRGRVFRGFGFDPSHGTGALRAEWADLVFRQGYFSPEALPAPTDAILLRHILEHQGDPHRFLGRVLPLGQPGLRVYIEVPAWEWIVDRLQIQAFSYEHCSYYSAASIQRVMAGHGFVTDALRFGFDDEYLQYFGRAATAAERDEGQDSAALARKTEAWARVLPALIERTRERLAACAGDAVLWGAAGKGTTFLNVLGIDDAVLPCVVDSNPRRQGTFIPGTGQAVIAPEALRARAPSLVLLTNPLYGREIAGQLAALGLSPRLQAIDELIRESALVVGWTP